MIILGIDPGTATTGWGTIKIQNSKFKIQNWSKNKQKAKSEKPIALIDYGCISTLKEWGMGRRLVYLRKSLRRLLGQLKPDIACVEEHFFGKNRKTALVVSQARGVILEAVATSKIPIFEYAGFKIKETLTGQRYAKKKQVETAVKKFLGKRKLQKPNNGFLDDAVDGLAIAIHHAITIGN